MSVTGRGKVAETTATEDEILTFPFHTRSYTIGGVKFEFRELSLAENDECADMSRGDDGAINPRTMTRLMIMKSCKSHTLTPKILAEMPQRIYSEIYMAVNDINSIQPDDDELVTVGDEGNA